MDKREAKRRVCRDVASELLDRLANGGVALMLDSDDRERYEESLGDLVEELLRRGRALPRQQVVDERQLDLFSEVRLPL